MANVKRRARSDAPYLANSTPLLIRVNEVHEVLEIGAVGEAALLAHMLNYPKADDPEGQARLKLRKEQSGLTHRDDIKCFVDYIDADEKRI